MLNLTVGLQVTNPAAFTTPHGCWFREGSVFVVESVGEVNTKCRELVTGAVVWISAGGFVGQTDKAVRS